jgi:hypothetical protein
MRIRDLGLVMLGEGLRVLRARLRGDGGVTLRCWQLLGTVEERDREPQVAY